MCFLWHDVIVLLMFFKMIFFLLFGFLRAPRELDGHARDPAGGHGVPAQVSWRHASRAAERRGAVSRRSQEDRCHGEIPMEI